MFRTNLFLNQKKHSYEIIVFFILYILIYILSFVYSNQAYLINSNPEPFDVDLQTKVIAISEIKGLYTGFVGHRSMYEDFKNQKVYKKYKINKVQSLEDKFDYKKVYYTDYSNSDRKLTLGIQDLGLVDFYKLSYKIFSVNSYSPTYFYYLILFISTLIYFISFSKDKSKLSILLFFGISHLIMVYFIEIVGNELYNVSNRRYLPTLSIIPTLHILLIILENRYRYLLNSICIFSQIIILFSIIHFRSSSEYQILIILSFITFFLIRNRKKLYETFSLKKNISLVLFFLLFVSIFFKSYVYLYKNPYYSLDRSGHLFWHAAYIGLSSHPESLNKYNIYPNDGATSPVVKSKTLELYGTDDWQKIGGTRLFEEIIKEEYFSILKKDPIYFLINYSIKPFHYLINFKNTILKFNINFVYYLLFITTINFIFIWRYKNYFMMDKKTTITLLFMLLVSFSPSMMLVPIMIYTSETNILLLTILLLLFSNFSIKLINFIKQRNKIV